MHENKEITAGLNVELNESDIYITASEFLLTCDREKMIQMILSNCIGIMSMRPWIWPGEKHSKEQSTCQSGWRPGII